MEGELALPMGVPTNRCGCRVCHAHSQRGAKSISPLIYLVGSLVILRHPYQRFVNQEVISDVQDYVDCFSPPEPPALLHSCCFGISECEVVIQEDPFPYKDSDRE